MSCPRVVAALDLQPEILRAARRRGRIEALPFNDRSFDVVLAVTVHYPPSGTAAQVLAPIEPLLTPFNAPGAAFLAVTANRSEERK